METFWQWLSHLKLIETYYGLDPAEYNHLFDMELEKVIARTRDPAHRQALESMKGFHWISYIAAAVRGAGYRDQREIQERAHDVATKLLVGGLFRDYDERRHGPMDLRFRRSVGNAVRNMAELARNRKRLLPTTPLDQAAEPASMTSDDGGEKVINDFRRLVKRRLGEIGTAVLNARLAGEETKSLVGSPALGSPGKYGIKRVVQELKQLAKDYAASLGDPGFLRDIEKAMAAESETIEKRRRATTAARVRQGVGA